jgi:hypothetical protein
MEDTYLPDAEIIVGKSIFKRAGGALKKIVRPKPKPKPKPKAKAKPAPKLIRPTATNRRLAIVAKTRPAQTKRAVGVLAAQDDNVKAGVNIYQDMKDPSTKPEATIAYQQTLKQAQAGDLQAQKAVGTIAALAESDRIAPQVPDTEIQRGVETYQETESEYESEYEPASYETSEEPDTSEEFSPAENESVEGETVLGGLITMGFSFGDMVKKAVGAVKPLVKTAQKVASLTPYGAAVNAAMNMATPALKMGATMLQQAQKGDPDAKAKVEQIKKLATGGSAQGIAALKTLQQAKELTNRVVAEARKMTGAKPTAILTVPQSTLPGGQNAGPVQIFILMPGPEAVKQIVATAQRAGSRFWVPATSLYQTGMK